MDSKRTTSKWAAIKRLQWKHCKRISVVLALAGVILRLAQSKSDLLLATLGPPKLARIGKRLSATILGSGPCEDVEDAAAFPSVLVDSFALAMSASRARIVALAILILP